MERYTDLNSLVDNPANCLTYTGYPPGLQPEDVRQIFYEFQLRDNGMDTPIKFNSSGRAALIEFASKAEAHRAYRILSGTKQSGAFGEFYTTLLFLM